MVDLGDGAMVEWCQVEKVHQPHQLLLLAGQDVQVDQRVRVGLPHLGMVKWCNGEKV